MEKELEVKDIRGFIRRRKKLFFGSFAFLFFAGIVVALSLHPIFISVATIRIEGQQIPKDLVNPTLSDFAEERIEKISQKVLVRSRLLDILEQYDLYPELRGKKTPTELYEKMKSEIIIEPIEAVVKSTKSGRPTVVTVAFNLSFEGKDPATVHKVTNTLANLYLKEDLKAREQFGAATTDFFETELKRLKTEISFQEKKISEFKENHIWELPSDKNSSLQAIARLQRSLDQTEMQLRLAQDKKLYLSSQLASIEPLTPIVIDGKDMAVNPKKRLKELRLKLASLRSIYSERHPDIKILKNEIAKLEAKVKNSDDSVDKVKKLNELEVRLASAKAELGPKHPDVIAIQKEILLIKNDIPDLQYSKLSTRISEEEPDNPVYINLKTQIEAIEIETRALNADKKKIIEEMEVYQRRLENAPFVEKELIALTRDYENLKEKYAEISNKLMNAKITKEMEGKQKGERFSIASPAYLPIKPSKPNRIALILLSFLFALGASSTLVVFKEGIDNTIKTPDHLKAVTGVPVLTSLSYIMTDREIRARRLKRLGWTLMLLLLIGLGLFGVDQYIMKLNDIWTVLLQRIMTIV
jgi:uncharacterized protein involved in exopolysaccharide biosynthesis